MKIYGYEENREALLTLSEASFAATPDEIRHIARFFQESVEKMEKWGDGFDHDARLQVNADR